VEFHLRGYETAVVYNVRMQQLLVYADSLSWGIIPTTRKRLPFDARWPGVMEIALNAGGHSVRVIEDCLNGRRTAWEDPFKPGRNGLIGLAQRIEINSPLGLVLLMLGTNDFQFTHANTAVHSALGLSALVSAIRQAPIEPGMPVPPILVVAPPPLVNPRGPIAVKFAGAAEKAVGLAQMLRATATELGCHYFDAGGVTPASVMDGIHLDADQHQMLGNALAVHVAALPGVLERPAPTSAPAVPTLVPGTLVPGTLAPGTLDHGTPAQSTSAPGTPTARDGNP
jgi:lysophospholipase L1-like esterase